MTDRDRHDVSPESRLAELGLTLPPPPGPLGTYEPFQQVLATDSYSPPKGSHRHRELFEEAYDGSRGPLLKAVLNALQFSGQAFDPAVEVTDQWALVWSDIRLKLSNAPEGGGQIEMSAPADRMTPGEWETRRTALVEDHVDRLDPVLQIREGLREPLVIIIHVRFEHPAKIRGHDSHHSALDEYPTTLFEEGQRLVVAEMLDEMLAEDRLNAVRLERQPAS